MTTYIAITDNGGDCQTYLTDTAEQRADARAALRALNEPFAPVYAGEPDGAGDSHRNGEVLYADGADTDREQQIAALGTAAGALFARENPGEVLDPSETDWDATAWDVDSAGLSREMRKELWPVYQAALIAETERLAR